MGGHIGRLLPAVQLYRPTKQLHPVSPGAGNGHVLQIQAADALHADVLRQDLLAPGQIGENTDLPSCIQSFHVGGGILLGVTLGLSLLQRLGKGDAAFYHPSENIVGGAVKDAHYLLDPVPRKTLEQRAQYRDASAYAGFKEVIDVFLSGNRKKLPPMGSHQLLVRGDNVLAGHKGPAGEVQRHLGAADGLHHHVQLSVVLQHREVLYRDVRVRRGG